ncbi:MAG: hypothetical protein ACE5F6_00120 [Anaerolineae bacterium]
MDKRLRDIGRVLVSSVWVTTISTLDKFDDDTARNVLVEIMRSTVTKTCAHLSQ